MVEIIKKFMKMVLLGPSELGETLTVRERYQRFRLTLLLVISTITVIPLLFTAAIGYYQYSNLLEKEEIDVLRWNAESAKKTIEAFLREQQSVITFLASDHSYKDLSNREYLGQLLSRLRNVYRGVVDLGIIDSEGNQHTYVGPYNLQGKNYRNSDWLIIAVARHVFISKVFMGYRKAPHFVIAVSRKVPDEEKFWVLRASLDTSTLEHYLNAVVTEYSDDIFLIDNDGALQTGTSVYRDENENYVLDKNFMPGKGGVVINEVMKGGVRSLHALARIEGTPWILVIVRKGYAYGANWAVFQKQLVFTLFAGLLLGLMVVWRTANLLAERIRESDEKREGILAEVQHSSRLASIGRLAAGVAHEINNPLAIIDQKAGLMDDVLDGVESFEQKDKFKGAILGIQGAVGRCKVITHRLLGFARRMDVQHEDIDVNGLLREILGFLDKEALYRHIDIEFVPDDNLPKILSDQGQLQQIFLNIFNNAIDAVEKDGGITVKTRTRPNGSVQVDIHDTGPGMPPEVMKHIFEPFFTTKGPGKGTGLGLSITYGLVRKLGGEIQVATEQGKGTTFTVVLPVNPSMREGGATNGKY